MEPRTNEKTHAAQQDDSCLQKFLSNVRKLSNTTAALHLVVAMFVLTLGVSLLGIMAFDLIQFRACMVQTGVNVTYCQGPGRSSPEVQSLLASINIWEEVLKNSIPIIFVLFAGAWSDIYGRKFLIMLAILGPLIICIALLVCVYTVTAGPVTLTLAVVLPGVLTGGSASGMAILLYIADATSAENRTILMSSLGSILALAVAAGLSLTGALKDAFGSNYTIIFAIAGSLTLISFVYTLLFVPNLPENAAKGRSFKRMLSDALDLRNVKECFRTFFKQREPGRRAQLHWIFVMILILKASQSGESGTFSLFATSKQVGWNISQLSYYSTYRVLMYSFVTVGTMIILVKVFKMTDATLGIISCISNIGGGFMFAFAHGTLMMYLAPVVDILGGTIQVVFKSLLTQLAPSNELGKILTVVTIGEACIALAFSPIYAAVYKMTLDTFPGAFFLLTIALTIPALALCCWFRCFPLNLRHTNEDKTSDKIEDCEDGQCNLENIIKD